MESVVSTLASRNIREEKENPLGLFQYCRVGIFCIHDSKRRKIQKTNPGYNRRGGRMKPRIIKICGIWHCGIRGIPNRHIGIGFTPCAAYRDWVRNA